MRILSQYLKIASSHLYLVQTELISTARMNKTRNEIYFILLLALLMNIRIKNIHQKIFFICLLPLYANNPIFYIFFHEQSIELGPGILLSDPAAADQGRKERKFGLKIKMKTRKRSSFFSDL